MKTWSEAIQEMSECITNTLNCLEVMTLRIDDLEERIKRLESEDK